MSNNQGRHRRPGPVRDTQTTIVLWLGSFLMISILLWAAGTVLAYVIDAAS